MTQAEAALTKEGVCARCAELPSAHANGNCPDGGGSFTWTFSREDTGRMIGRMQDALAAYDARQWWRKVAADPIPRDRVESWAREYRMDVPPNEIARRAWGAEADTHNGRFWQEFLFDVCMALSDLQSGLWFLTGPPGPVRNCNHYEEQGCKDKCTCPKYPCPCGYDPFDIAKMWLGFADHYSGVAMERAARMFPEDTE